MSFAREVRRRHQVAEAKERRKAAARRRRQVRTPFEGMKGFKPKTRSNDASAT